MPVSRSTPAAPAPAPPPPPLQAAASGMGSAPCLPDVIKLLAMAGTRTTGWDVLPARSILAGVHRQQSSQALHHTGQQDTCSTFGVGQATHAQPAQPPGLARHDLTMGAASGLDQPAVSSAAPPSPLSAVRDRNPAALDVPATSQLPDAPAPPSPLSDLRNVAILSPTWSPPGTPAPVLPPSRQRSLDDHGCLPVNHSLSSTHQQRYELQGKSRQPGEVVVSGIKQEPEQHVWVPGQVDAQGSKEQQVACAGHQQPQQGQVLIQKADASAQQQAKVAAPTAQQHHQSTHEPWGGLSCYELWSACAYAVQGVVQQVCGGTPPSQAGLDACLAAVQLHGFLIRLAAGWWADPGAALEWLPAGFPQLSTAVPAMGRVLESAQAVHCCGLNSDTIANMSGSNTSRKGESNPHLSSQQLQYCLHCLSDTLQPAGASEQETLHLLSSVAGQLGTERACASRCIAALHQGVMSEKTCSGAISRGTKRSLDGMPVTTAGCAGHTLPCKPCLSGRCHQQLVIAVAGAEGLGLLGVGHVCLVDWVSNAMALEA
jgi:hypothetical protein